MRVALSFFDITHKRLPLVHRNVRVGYQRRQLIDNVSRGQTFIAPVPRHAHLVDDFAVDLEGPHPARDQGLGADLRPRAGDIAPVEVFDASLLGQLGTDLDEKLWLQLV